MTAPLRALLEQAMALPDDERAELAGLLLESLEPTDEPEVSEDVWRAAWSAEAERRVRAVDAGGETIDAEEVLAAVRAHLSSRS